MNYTIFLDNYAVNENGYLTSNGTFKKKSTEKNKDFTVYNAKASLELNAAGSLEFTMPPTHPRYNGYKYYVGDDYKKAKQRYNSVISAINTSIPEYKDAILDGSAEHSFGNIDMDKRGRCVWTESGTNSTDKTVKGAASWGYTPVKDEYETVYPKVLSFTIENVSEKVYVLMSPLIYLNSYTSWIPKKVAKSYIKSILDKSVSRGTIDKNKVLQLDAKGLSVKGYAIRWMIADVCLASERSSSDFSTKVALLTYAGKYGKLQCAKDDMASAPTKNKYWTKGIVTLKEGNNFIFAGRAYAYSIDIYKRKTITVEGALNFLKDSIQPAREYVDQTLFNIICTWLEIHNRQVDDNRKIYPGDLSILATAEVYRVTDYETTWDCLQKFVLDTNGGYFFISIWNGVGSNKPVLYLNYIVDSIYKYHRSSPNGQYVTSLINDQVMRFKENLLDITENFSLDGLYTVVLPLGKIKTEEEEEEEEESGGDSGDGGGSEGSGGESSEPTDIGSLSGTAQGTGVATGTGTWIRSGPGGGYDPIGEYPWINGGDRVEVCDIAYNESGEGWYYVRVVRSYYGFINPMEFDAQVSLSQLPHYRG